MAARQEIIEGDCLEILPTLAEKSVQCVITSPPYWGLRSYGFKPDDPSRKKMIGLEPTFDRHLWNLVRVFREVRRVLRDDGTLWLNYGDAYLGDSDSGPQGINGQRSDRRFTATVPAKRMLPAKNLIGMAWRVAFALQADDWYLRSDIIWHKRSPMPESAGDRATRAHEYVFLISKRPRYYYDQMASRERSTSGPSDIRKMVEGYERMGGKAKKDDDPLHCATALTNIGRLAGCGSPVGRNMRSVWTLSSEPFRGAHFAVFPTELVARCLRPGTSEKGCCATCGAPWRRLIERERRATRPGTGSKVRAPSGWDIGTGAHGQKGSDGRRGAEECGNRDEYRNVTDFTTVGWAATCKCVQSTVYSLRTCTVLDPFAGSGTVGVVCRRMGLNFVGIELNPDYAAMGRKRIERALQDGAPEAAPVVGQMELPITNYELQITNEKS